MKNLRISLASACAGLLLAAGVLAGTTVDINRADAAELDRALKGVGPAKAAAIVEYRRQHGPFRSIEDLAKVQGIGPAIIDQNRGQITLGEAKRP